MRIEFPSMGLLCAALTLLQGCAFSDVTVYPPPPMPATGHTLGRDREVSVVTPFIDQRATLDRCGMQKNGYNIDTASVHCSVAPALWLSQALSDGLSNAGFRVRSSGAPVSVQGTVQQFFVEPKVEAFTFSPEADIGVKLVVTSRTGLRAERVFFVKGVEGAFAGTEDKFQGATTNATREIVGRMVLAIAALLDDQEATAAPAAERVAGGCTGTCSGLVVQR